MEILRKKLNELRIQATNIKEDLSLLKRDGEFGSLKGYNKASEEKVKKYNNYLEDSIRELI